MKKFVAPAIIICTLFSSLSMVSASELYTKTDKNIESSTDVSSKAIYFKTLKVGESIYLFGYSLIIAYGSTHVKVTSTTITGTSTGSAKVYAYRNGKLSKTLYITVVK